MTAANDNRRVGRSQRASELVGERDESGRWAYETVARIGSGRIGEHSVGDKASERVRDDGQR